MEKDRELQGRENGRNGCVVQRLVSLFVGESPAIPDTRILETKILLRPDEVADILRISRSNVYDLCTNKELESVRIGRCIRIKSKQRPRNNDPE